jgi:hypothetical protein
MRCKSSMIVPVLPIIVALSGPACAQRPIEVVVLDLELTCDSEQCRTPVLQIHERTGKEASYLEYVFSAPPGITLDYTRTTGVEVDGEGANHYVRASADGAGSFTCKWLAQGRPGEGNGLARGYCWIAIKR